MPATDEHAEIRDRASNDPFCGRVGIELADVGEGSAETTMTIDEDHLNFHGTPHGGCIYTLADAAFAAASNSHGDAAFALETNISYLAAAEVGDTITAVAEETHLGGRTAEYEVVVSDDAGDRIATFRGRVYKPGR
ncbi:hydroxyphenylacetyl-CoA thioesterase PaaI [Haloferax sp. MBLA0076]|uniref:Hydroxyphenylacetyl-CoA thioesterase PaaI n=1 Tax=Haloferax litoreum TaxID=2666140 RepID=A0A6A8GKJ2_9EURY|nr:MULTISPECIES: hydroxyphenylacetyl-CoA thioesterase PaaI [Haloferax]KAB1189872.1 hydroxyphenylacetyl-CoA thioesterase PaaI [Haloferax sp. CBA1148]MRX23635.1 hydroxyphenylacetyl-CoA thioesterase PaaI [Haloferax litoreum]